MKYNCLIVDDERPALKLLEAYIKKLPHLHLNDACENAVQAISALQKYEIDILFLDIQMPELTGLDLLKVLKDPPQVILTTAYREYAVEGFSLDVTDYLVKPFSFERFLQGVNKATEQINLKKKPQPGSEASASVEVQPQEDHFFVKTNYKMEKVVFRDILFIESMREYVAIHTSEKKYVLNYSMNYMQEVLPTTSFMRVHRSFLVGLAHIQGLKGNVILLAGNEIPIGASYKKAFMEQLRLL